MENDDDLILRCQRDPAAFRALVERYQGRIHGFLIRLAGRERADDLFQEVWLKVLKHSDRYTARGKTAGWLFKIAHNAFLDDLTKHRNDNTRWEGEGEIEGFADGAPGPAEQLERDESRLSVDAAIAALPLEQRKVFLLREYGCMPFKDIAATLGIPLGTALSRMNYALDKLRTALEDRRAS